MTIVHESVALRSASSSSMAGIAPKRREIGLALGWGGMVLGQGGLEVSGIPQFGGSCCHRSPRLYRGRAVVGADEVV